MSIPSSRQVQVKPHARESRLQCGTDVRWLAKIKAQPVDGKANAALIALIADHFKLRKNQISIKSGAGTRIKRLLITA